MSYILKIYEQYGDSLFLWLSEMFFFLCGNRCWSTMCLEVRNLASIYEWTISIFGYLPTKKWKFSYLIQRLWLIFSYKLFLGKLNRGLSVIDSYKLLHPGKKLNEEEFFLACVLGWCIEWVSSLSTLCFSKSSLRKICWLPLEYMPT